MNSLEWLFGLEQFGIKLGLENISALLGALGHPERTFRSIHVAGTNGKGSVTAMVDAAVRAAGHRSARYTSPHLIDLTERFVVDGHPVAHEDMTRVLDDIRNMVEGMRHSGTLDVLPTFFEITTAAAFELFRRAHVDVAVCEVGLGGRLDATNVLEPVASAITTIGFDHQQYLGSTIEAIAREKAGIVKPGVPLVVGRMDARAAEVIHLRAAEVGAPAIDAWDGVEVHAAQDPSRVHMRTPERDYGELTLALLGRHQIDNAVVAVRLLETIGTAIAMPAGAVLDGLTRVSWPARLDLRRLPDGREALLDAAHNADGATALAAFLTSESDVKQPLVFGSMRDKDAAAMLDVLVPAVSSVVITRALTPRSADPDELAAIVRAIAPKVRVAVCPSIHEALDAAWREAPRITVAGSIFLLGDVMKEFGWT
jgi:dihydrofolate synthase / folylpolyglutamate synthase